jgi:hypothetical protein
VEESEMPKGETRKALDALSDVLGRRGMKRLRREAFALMDRKAPMIEEHGGGEMSAEAREAAYAELLEPEVEKLIARHVAEAMVKTYAAELLAKGGHVRIQSPEGGSSLVPRDRVTEQHRAAVRAERIRCRLARHAAEPRP